MFTYKPIFLIVAHDLSFGISKNEIIPWKYTKDISFFRRKTINVINPSKRNALYMGRKTFEQFPMIDENRIYVVLTTTLHSSVYPNVFYVSSIEEGYTFCHNYDEIESVFICSKSLYEYTIQNKLMQKSYVTYIKHDHECDSFIKPYIEGYSEIIEDDENLTITSYTHNDIEYVHKHQEFQYLNVLEKVLYDGHSRETRNGITISIFGSTMTFDLSDNQFPLLTTKRITWKNVTQELLFMLRGYTDTTILSEQGNKIWEGNTTRAFLDQRGLYDYKVGDMGPMYGYQLRSYGKPYHTKTEKEYVDQLKNVIKLLLTDPYSRRIMMTTYNPDVSSQCVLDPCHGIVIQFYVSENNTLYCQMYQRSADLFLGVPYNIAFYSLFLHMIASLCNFKPGKLMIVFGDLHIYEEHITVVKKQLSRPPVRSPFIQYSPRFSTMIENIHSIEDIDQKVNEIMGVIDDNSIHVDDFIIRNYYPHEFITATMKA